MGMICCLQPIAAERIDILLSNPESIHDMLESGYDAGIDLDKSWHAIHFLLTGSAWEGEAPGSYLLSGGEQVGDEDVGYGPARVLRPSEVQRFASFLSAIHIDELKLRYDPAAMQQAEIYPDIWDREAEREDNFDYVATYFEDLRKFIATKAQDGDGVIVSLA